MRQMDRELQVVNYHPRRREHYYRGIRQLAGLDPGQFRREVANLRAVQHLFLVYEALLPEAARFSSFYAAELDRLFKLRHFASDHEKGKFLEALFEAFEQLPDVDDLHARLNRHAATALATEGVWVRRSALNLVSVYTGPNDHQVLDRLAVAIREDADWVVRARAYTILRRNGRRRDAARARIQDRFLSMLFK